MTEAVEPPSSTLGSTISNSSISLAEAATYICADYADQMCTTVLAIKDRLLHTRRRIRQTYLDLKDLSEDAMREGGKCRTMLRNALLDDSVLRERYIDERIELQEVYFGISLMMWALSLGGIVGNIWAGFSSLPRLGVIPALMVISFLLCRILWVFKENPVDPKTSFHRSSFCRTLWIVGFALGNFCPYSLVMTAPRLLCPLALAFLIDTKIRFYPSVFRGNRLEFFMVVALLVNILCWILLLIFREMTLFGFCGSIFMNGIKLAFIFAHFQMLYFAHCTLLKQETGTAASSSQDEHKDATHDDGEHLLSQQQEQMDIDMWDNGAHFLYVLAAVILDIVIACVHSV